MVLLLALKIRHPARIFLLRGNHELPEVNARDGFLLECCQRLESKKKKQIKSISATQFKDGFCLNQSLSFKRKETIKPVCFLLQCKEAGIEAWHCFNSLFDWLPLAATINGVILCLHGGVGATLNHLEDLRRMPYLL
ncbi:Metallo-dependent phosphatase-like protein [Pavlovales sp. CCMP2436]|nr:Metallo-dependent phosphatase-like protein [Pavlovales sp. CCMP2436]